MGTKVNLYKQSGTDDGTSVNFNLPRSLTYGLNARANDDGGVTESDNCEYNTLNGLSTLLKSSSLIITPNSYKEGKLYSVIPSDGSGDMSVTRATTATRVNSAGLVELVPYNLLQYSEQFDNSYWFKANGSSVTSNSTIAPNGTLTADTLNVSTTAYSTIYNQNLFGFVNGVYTQTIYAKKSTKNWLYILDLAGSGAKAWFNLDTGVVGTVAIGYTASMESVGNGWYRCLLSQNSNPALYYQFGASDADNSFTPSSSGSIYIWGAQLVEGTSALDYQRTETRLNIPRLDYSNGTCPSLLVEPQRTNLVTYSSSFDNSAYNKTNVSVTANTSTSPDGTQNADTITSNASSPQLLSPLVSFATSTSVSLFVKYVSQKYVQLFGGGAFGDFANFDLENAIVGTIGASTTNAKIENYGNGWLRISAVFSGFSGSTTARLGFTSALNSGWNSLDSAFNKSVLAYGFQIEAGTYATSYIPTTSATVTRNADAISKTGISSLIGQSEGTIFWDIDDITGTISGTGNPDFGIRNTAFTNWIGLTTNTFAEPFRIVVRPTSGIMIDYTANITRAKAAVKYGSFGAILFVNGVQVATSAVNPNFTFDIVDMSGAIISYRNNSFILWPIALTNTQLAQLTTI